MATTIDAPKPDPSEPAFDLLTDGPSRPTSKQRHIARMAGELSSTNRTLFMSGAGKVFIETDDLNELTDKMWEVFGGQFSFTVTTHEGNLYYKVTTE